MNSENIEESSQNRAKANSFRAQIRSQLISKNPSIFNFH